MALKKDIMNILYPKSLMVMMVKILGIWQNIIDTRGFFCLKLNTSIDDDNIVFILDGHHILTDFLDTTNGLGANQDLTKTATTDASSKTFGLRLDGVRKVSDDWKVLYTAEYAKQSDYAGGSPLIDAHYFKLGGGAAYDV